MINAIIENVSAVAGDPQLSPHTDVKPDVMGFYDASTGSIQYIVADPNTRKCAIIDPVLITSMRLVMLAPPAARRRREA
jgi:hypothetical protein